MGWQPLPACHVPTAQWTSSSLTQAGSLPMSLLWGGAARFGVVWALKEFWLRLDTVAGEALGGGTKEPHLPHS